MRICLSLLPHQTTIGKEHQGFLASFNFFRSTKDTQNVVFLLKPSLIISYSLFSFNFNIYYFLFLISPDVFISSAFLYSLNILHKILRLIPSLPACARTVKVLVSQTCFCIIFLRYSANAKKENNITSNFSFTIPLSLNNKSLIIEKKNSLLSFKSTESTPTAALC